MARNWGRQRKKKRRFERSGSVVLGRAQLVQAPKMIRETGMRGWLAIVLLVSVLAVAAALWLTLDEHFYVYHADVEGARRVSSEEIFRSSGLEGLHILWARPAQIEARILDAHPRLGSAEVTCGLPADCTIAVVERQPKVTWDEAGELWWIDEEGVIFPAEDTLPDGWVVRGPLPRDDEGHLDERVHVALSELWASGMDPSVELHYVEDRGLVFADERGWRVVLGRGSGMERRLEVLEQLTAHLESQDVTPRFVDVRFPSAPYYSLTNEW